MARPPAPESRTTSTSTVGLPRESRTSRAAIFSMAVISCCPCCKCCRSYSLTPGRRRSRPGIGRRDRWWWGGFRPTGWRRPGAGDGLRLQPDRASEASMRRRNAPAAPRNAVSGSTPRRRATSATAKSISPSGVDRGGRGLQGLTRGLRGGPVGTALARGGAGQRVEAGGDLAPAIVERSGVDPERLRLALELGRQRQGRERPGDAVGDAGAALLGLLQHLPPGGHVLGGLGHGVAEDVRVAADELVVQGPGHVGQGEVALLGRQQGVEVHLEQQVTELLLEVGDVDRGHVGLGGGDHLDGVERLVGLLEEVARQRPVGLAPVPGTARPQRADQLLERHELGGHRRSQARHPQGGEVVGLEGAVEVGPRHLHHLLVGEPQMVQEHGAARRGPPPPRRRRPA